MTKEEIGLYKKIQSVMKIVLIAMLFLLGGTSFPEQAKAAVSAVEVKEINYDESTILIQSNGNTKVYYSDSKQIYWYEVEGKANSAGYLELDISWISEKSDYVLCLKGSEVDTIVKLTLPAANSDLSVSFDKMTGKLEFEDEGTGKTFQWRKDNSYLWSSAENIKQSESFLNQLEEFRIKGCKIIIRLPQVKGTSATNVGNRASREVKVTISKRGNAPTAKVSSNKLYVTTKDSMEYLIYAIGGTETGNTKWTTASKNMSISKLAPGAIYSDSNKTPKDVVIAIRSSETERKPYSKLTYITIPAQDKAPDTVVESYTSSTYMLSFGDASDEKVYQYAIVKPGASWNERKASWRTVKSPKTVVLKLSSYPVGTKVYVRIKGVDETSKYSPVLPSAYKEYKVTYVTNTTKK